VLRLITVEDVLDYVQESGTKTNSRPENVVHDLAARMFIRIQIG